MFDQEKKTDDGIVASSLLAVIESPTASGRSGVVTHATAGSAPAAPQVKDDEAIARLAALKPMEYDRIRKEEAKALGVQVGTLDGLVKAARNEDLEVDR